MFANVIKYFPRHIRSKKVDITVYPFSITPVKSDVIKINNVEEFKSKVLNSKVPVVVDFFATWCNPCKELDPRLEMVVAEKKGKIVIAKVDIDELTDVALQYDVSSVPVLVAVKNGKVQQRLVGLQETDKLRKWIADMTKETDEKEIK